MAIASSVVSFDKGYIPSPDEPILDSMLQQYERVLLESIITSFGLDFIVFRTFRQKNSRLIPIIVKYFLLL